MESDQSGNHNQHIMNKKRTYIKMTDKIRYEFTFRTLVLGESGIVVARALGINYFTAQNMVTLFKQAALARSPQIRKPPTRMLRKKRNQNYCLDWIFITKTESYLSSSLIK